MAQDLFYALTPEISQKLLSAKLTAAQWRLWVYLVNLDPFGDRYQDLPDMLEIMEVLNMSKSTFYAAIAKFQKLELFDFQNKGFSFCTLISRPRKQTPIQKNGRQSKKTDNRPKNRTPVRKIGQPSEKSDNQSLETLPSLKSEDSQTNKTIQTLSETRERDIDFCSNKIPESSREKFLAFARSKAAQLPNPPQLVEKWIAVNINWIKQEFDKTYPQDPLPTGENKGSTAVQKSNNPMGWDLKILKRIYPNTWREAAFHFGFEVEEEETPQLPENKQYPEQPKRVAEDVES